MQQTTDNTPRLPSTLSWCWPRTCACQLQQVCRREIKVIREREESQEVNELWCKRR